MRQVAAVLLTIVLVAVGCSVTAAEVAVDLDGAATSSEANFDGLAQTPETDGATETTPTNEPDEVTTTGDLSCLSPGGSFATGLTQDGLDLFERHENRETTIPTYLLDAAIDPATGLVTAILNATIETTEDMDFRVFAGMEAFDANFGVNDVRVNGEPANYALDRALLTIDASTDDVQVVEFDFTYAIDEMAANENIFAGLSGDSLQPDQVGLLGRTETGMQLGHWFPVWLPAGTRTDPDPSGFGDIGAFPAAKICAAITTPAGYEIVTGGVRSGRSNSEDSLTVVDGGAGLRDLAVLISNDLIERSATVGDTNIRVWGPGADPEAVDIVLDYSVQSQEALNEAFGDYPWTEIDVVATPLGSGVGGMEWPGMLWIERTMFGGGLPGMGDLGEFGDLFGEEFDIEAMLGDIGGDAISTTLEWTVAHEFAHEWWHATVGNDSIASPAVDEPLAQFGACIAMERIHPDRWRDICNAQTIDQYAQARALGIADVAAEMASDEFDSAIQYGAIVYGKAPGFYFEAAEVMGWDELVAALHDFVQANAFDLVATDALRSHLVDSAGDQGDQIGELWDRWFRSALGDEDIDVTAGGLAGLGDLGEIEGLEDLDLDELLGDNAELFDALLEGDSEALDEFFNDLLEPEGAN